MNKIYKLKFDRKQQQLIVVSELATGAGKDKTTGSTLLPAAQQLLSLLHWLTGKLTPLALSLSLVVLPAASSYAADLPTGGQIVGGTGQISTSGKQMTISQQSQKLAANWQSFDIGQNHSVQFVQPNSSAIALNRVTGQSASQIMGQLSANGKVFLINPNGVMVGKDAQVNTAGFLASTKNLSVNDFMQGNYRLKGGSATNAEIVNQGSLTTSKGGFIVLAADKVRNEGSISTPHGKTVLAAADQVTLTLDNNGLTGISVSGNVVNALVENKGLISARDGKVYLTARGRDMLVKTVVNNSGIIDASSMSVQNGIVHIGSSASATTSNTNNRPASGAGSTTANNASNTASTAANNNTNNPVSNNAANQPASGADSTMANNGSNTASTAANSGTTGGVTNTNSNASRTAANNASNKPANSSLVNNSVNTGKILADNGAASATANTASGAGSTTVNNASNTASTAVNNNTSPASALNTNGIASASGISTNGGEIHIDGGESGVVSQSGSLLANSDSGKGGNIVIEGQLIHLAQGSHTEATGATSGGSVLVGGGWQGKDSRIKNADKLVMDSGAAIDVSATQQGNGGTAVLWSEHYTNFQGNIKAQGGTTGGNGGQVETSSQSNLQAFGSVSTSALQGKGGAWLLDPVDVSIVSGAGNVAANVFTPTASGAQIGANSIQSALNSGDVTIKTSGANIAGQLGNITVSANITNSATSGRSLTLWADKDISFGNNIKIESTGSLLNFNLYAGANSNISLGSFVTFNLRGGDFYAGTQSRITNGVTFKTSNNGNINAKDIRLDSAIENSFLSMTASNNLTINGKFTTFAGYTGTPVYSAGNKLTINTRGEDFTTSNSESQGRVELKGGTGGVEINARNINMSSSNKIDANLSRITSQSNIILNGTRVSLDKIKIEATGNINFTTKTQTVRLTNSDLTGANINAVGIRNGNDQDAWIMDNSTLTATTGDITIKNNPVYAATNVDGATVYKFGGAIFNVNNIIKASQGNISLIFISEKDQNASARLTGNAFSITNGNKFTAKNITLNGSIKGVRRGRGLSIDSNDINNKIDITATEGNVNLIGTGNARYVSTNIVYPGYDTDLGVDAVYLRNANIRAQQTLAISGQAILLNPISRFQTYGRAGYGVTIDSITVNAGSANIRGYANGGVDKNTRVSRGFDIKNISWQGGVTDGTNITLSSAGTSSGASNNVIGSGGLTTEQYKKVLPKGIENNTYVWLNDILPASGDLDQSYLSTNSAKNALWIVKDQTKNNYAGNVSVAGLNFENTTLSNNGNLTVKNGYLRNNSNFTAVNNASIENLEVTNSKITGANIRAMNANINSSTLKATNEITANDVDIVSGSLTTTTGNISFGGTKYVKLRGTSETNGVKVTSGKDINVNIDQVPDNGAALIVSNNASLKAATEGNITINISGNKTSGGDSPTFYANGANFKAKKIEVNLTVNGTVAGAMQVRNSATNFDGNLTLKASLGTGFRSFVNNNDVIGGVPNLISIGEGATLNINGTGSNSITASTTQGQAVLVRGTVNTKGNLLINGTSRAGEGLRIHNNGGVTAVPVTAGATPSAAITLEGHSTSSTGVNLTSRKPLINVTINGTSTSDTGVIVNTTLTDVTLKGSSDSDSGVWLTGSSKLLNTSITGESNTGTGVDTDKANGTLTGGSTGIQGDKTSVITGIINGASGIGVRLRSNVHGGAKTADDIMKIHGIAKGNGEAVRLENATTPPDTPITLTNVSLDGVASGSGYAVNVSGSPTLNNADISGTKEASATSGGAVRISGTGTLTSDANSHISGTIKSADNTAAAVTVADSVTLNHANISGTATKGSGIDLNGSNVRVSDTDLKGHSTSGAGIHTAGTVTLTSTSARTLIGSSGNGTGISTSGTLNSDNNITLQGSATQTGGIGVKLAGTVNNGKIVGSALDTAGVEIAQDTLINGGTIDGNTTGNTTTSTAAASSVGVKLLGNNTLNSVLLNGTSEGGTGVKIEAAARPNNLLQGSKDTVIKGYTNSNSGTGVELLTNVRGATPDGSTEGHIMTISGEAKSPSNGTGLIVNIADPVTPESLVNVSLTGLAHGNGDGVQVKSNVTLNSTSTITGSNDAVKNDDKGITGGNGVLIDGSGKQITITGGTITGSSKEKDGVQLANNASLGDASNTIRTTVHGSSSNGSGVNASGNNSLTNADISGTSSSATGVSLTSSGSLSKTHITGNTNGSKDGIAGVLVKGTATLMGDKDSSITGTAHKDSSITAPDRNSGTGVILQSDIDAHPAGATDKEKMHVKGISEGNGDGVQLKKNDIMLTDVIVEGLVTDTGGGTAVNIANGAKLTNTDIKGTDSGTTAGGAGVKIKGTVTNTSPGSGSLTGDSAAGDGVQVADGSTVTALPLQGNTTNGIGVHFSGGATLNNSPVSGNSKGTGSGVVTESGTLSMTGDEGKRTIEGTASGAGGTAVTLNGTTLDNIHQITGTATAEKGNGVLLKGSVQGMGTAAIPVCGTATSGAGVKFDSATVTNLTINGSTDSGSGVEFSGDNHLTSTPVTGTSASGIGVKTNTGSTLSADKGNSLITAKTTGDSGTAARLSGEINNVHVKVADDSKGGTGNTGIKLVSATINSSSLTTSTTDGKALEVVDDGTKTPSKLDSTSSVTSGSTGTGTGLLIAKDATLQLAAGSTVNTGTSGSGTGLEVAKGGTLNLAADTSLASDATSSDGTGILIAGTVTGAGTGADNSKLTSNSKNGGTAVQVAAGSTLDNITVQAKTAGTRDSDRAVVFNGGTPATSATVTHVSNSHIDAKVTNGAGNAKGSAIEIAADADIVSDDSTLMNGSAESGIGVVLGGKVNGAQINGKSASNVGLSLTDGVDLTNGRHSGRSNSPDKAGAEFKGNSTLINTTISGLNTHGGPSVLIDTGSTGKMKLDGDSVVNGGEGHNDEGNPVKGSGIGVSIAGTIEGTGEGVGKINGHSSTDDGVKIAPADGATETRLNKVTVDGSSEAKAGVNIAAKTTLNGGSTVSGHNEGSGGSAVAINADVLSTDNEPIDPNTPPNPKNLIKGETSAAGTGGIVVNSGTVSNLQLIGSAVDRAGVQGNASPMLFTDSLVKGKSKTHDGVNFANPATLVHTIVDGLSEATTADKSGVHFAEDTTLENGSSIIGINTGTGAGVIVDKELSGSGTGPNKIEGDTTRGSGDAVVIKGSTVAHVAVSGTAGAGHAVEVSNPSHTPVTFTSSTVEGTSSGSNSAVHLAEETSLENGSTVSGTNTGTGAGVTADKDLSGKGTGPNKIEGDTTRGSGDGLVINSSTVNSLDLKGKSKDGEGSKFTGPVRVSRSTVEGSTASTDSDHSGIHFVEKTTLGDNTHIEGTNTGAGAAVTFDKDLIGSSPDTSTVSGDTSGGSGSAVALKGSKVAHVAVSGTAGAGHAVEVSNPSHTPVTFTSSTIEGTSSGSNSAIQLAEDSSLEDSSVAGRNTGSGEGVSAGKDVGLKNSTINGESAQNSGAHIAGNLDMKQHSTVKATSNGGDQPALHIGGNVLGDDGEPEDKRPDADSREFNKLLATITSGSNTAPAIQIDGEKIANIGAIIGRTNNHVPAILLTNPNQSLRNTVLDGKSPNSNEEVHSSASSPTELVKSENKVFIFGRNNMQADSNPPTDSNPLIPEPAPLPTPEPQPPAADSDIHSAIESVQYLRAMLEKSGDDFGIISQQWKTNNHFKDKSNMVEVRICSGISSETCYSVFMDSQNPIWKIVRRES